MQHKLLKHSLVTHFNDWLLSLVIVALLLAGMIGGTLVLTAFLVSDDTENAARWGWLMMWSEFRSPYDFEPLVCEDSQADELTQQYLRVNHDTPFKFSDFVIEPIDDHRVGVKTVVSCTIGDDTVETLWEAQFWTRFQLPVGICVETIYVTSSEANPCPLD